MPVSRLWESFTVSWGENKSVNFLQALLCQGCSQALSFPAHKSLKVPCNKLDRMSSNCESLSCDVMRSFQVMAKDFPRVTQAIAQNSVTNVDSLGVIGDESAFRVFWWRKRSNFSCDCLKSASIFRNPFFSLSSIASICYAKASRVSVWNGRRHLFFIVEA